MYRRILHFLSSLLLIWGTAGDAWATVRNDGQAPASDPQLVAGMLEGVGDAWRQVTLPHSYQSMVVVAIPQYGPEQAPAVVRIRNAVGNSFEIKLQNPSGQSISDYAVSYFVVEEGVYTEAQHGVKMEAVRIASIKTDHKAFWAGQLSKFSNTYFRPVVLGQVMTYNDPRWSVFWSHGLTVDNPPAFGVLYVGKHVGEDPDRERKDETIGYVVMEAGLHKVRGYDFEAIAGEDIVSGFENDAPFAYKHQMGAVGMATASLAGMNGGNGAWAVLWGDNPISKTVVNLVADEDQVADEERNHTTEQAHVVVFKPVQSPPEISSFSPSTGGAGAVVSIEGAFLYGVTSVTIGDVPASFTEVSEGMLDVIVPGNAVTGPIRVTTGIGEAVSTDDFQFIQVARLEPIRGEAASTVLITGSGFLKSQSVVFNGDQEAVFSIESDNELRAQVPDGALSGPVLVLTEAADTLASPVDFIVTYATPVTGMNLCRLTGASASQSSLAFPFSIAEKACDGRIEGTLENGSYAGTEVDVDAWWETNLSAVYAIDRIAIWNRTDCCQAELANFYVFVSETPFVSESIPTILADPTVSAYVVDDVGEVEVIEVDRPGQYIRLQHIGTAALSLAEVEVVAGVGPGIEVGAETLPESGRLALAPAYPNPFNDHTEIVYELPEAGQVQLALYDLLGRNVGVLVDAFQAGGRHRFTFEAANLPDGVYYIRLRTPGGIRVGSIVLAR